MKKILDIENQKAVHLNIETLLQCLNLRMSVATLLCIITCVVREFDRIVLSQIEHDKLHTYQK